MNCSEVTASLDPNTPAVEYFYDGKGLEGSVAPRVGTVNPIFAKGKLTKVTSSISETRYTNFDQFGRLTQMEQRTPVNGETLANATARVSSYQYNFAGALVKETYPSLREVNNEFEADGDLSRIYGKANPNSTERTYANGFSYTADGKIQRLKLGNNRWESAKFNDRLQLTELALGTSDGDGSLWKLGYEYGELENGTVNTAKNTGNIAKQTLSFTGLTNPLVQTFKYDSLYRLTEAKETSGTDRTWEERFGYDRYGNRTGLEKFSGASTTPLPLDNKTHPAINPTTNRFNTGQGYTYDKNGNLIDDPEGRTFIFNGENKQRYVVKNGQNVGEYFYDGEGNRVKKKVYDANGVTIKEETIFVYSAGKLVEEYSTKTPPQNPTTSYTVTDQLLSPRIITDSNGNVVSRRDFMPFGEEITNNIGERAAESLKYGVADGIRQKFTGYQKDDETSLDFAEARMYENRHGRFTAVDQYNIVVEIKEEKNREKAKAKLNRYISQPQQWNRYVYTVNNPLKYTDPTGDVIWITGTEKERNIGLQRIRNLLGEERMKFVKMVSISTDDGEIYRLSINDEDVAAFQKIGTDDINKEYSFGMGEMINSDEVIEYRVTEKFVNFKGYTIDLNTDLYSGALTVSGEASTTGNIQIYVSPRAGEIATEVARRRGGSTNLTSDGKAFKPTNTEVDAHEFGHAWDRFKELGPRAMRPTFTGEPGWKVFENAARTWTNNPQRRIKHN